MRSVLAELCVESEAAVWMALLLARTFEDGRVGPRSSPQTAFRRLATAVAKYWVCKRAPLVVGEALECIGGKCVQESGCYFARKLYSLLYPCSGYASEWDFERWYRQAPLNAIWEGSSNVQALDVLRTCARDPEALRAFFEQLRRTRGVHPALDAFTAHAETLAVTVTTQADSSTAAVFARHLLEQLALALQGHALALGVQGRPGDASDLRSVLALWCSLRLPAASAVSGASLPFCLGAASPSQLRDAAAFASGGAASGGNLTGREAAILDAVLERELAAIKAASVGS